MGQRLNVSISSRMLTYGDVRLIRMGERYLLSKGYGVTVTSDVMRGARAPFVKGLFSLRLFSTFLDFIVIAL